MIDFSTLLLMNSCFHSSFIISSEFQIVKFFPNFLSFQTIWKNWLNQSWNKFFGPDLNVKSINQRKIRVSLGDPTAFWKIYPFHLCQPGRRVGVCDFAKILDLILHNKIVARQQIMISQKFQNIHIFWLDDLLCLTNSNLGGNFQSLSSLFQFVCIYYWKSEDKWEVAEPTAGWCRRKVRVTKFTSLIKDWLVDTSPVFLFMVNGKGSDGFVLRNRPSVFSKPNSKSISSSVIACAWAMTVPILVESGMVQSRLILIGGGGLSEA